MFYGAVVWDPLLIVAQIVRIQCLYYLTLGFLLAIFVGTRVSRMSLVYFFDYATVTTSTVTGRSVIASCMLSSIVGAGFLLYLIQRAKKCLEFSATLYIIHLFICIIYGGWPSSITWWVVNVTGLALMALVGEYLCITRELQEIPITRLRSASKECHARHERSEKASSTIKSANPGAPSANPGAPSANPGAPRANPGAPRANPGAPSAPRQAGVEDWLRAAPLPIDVEDWLRVVPLPIDVEMGLDDMSDLESVVTEISDLVGPSMSSNASSG